jgi:nitroreductase
MEVYDAVRTVLAVRQYQDKAVPAEVIQQVLESGRLTGSSMNKQPWHFIVVQERETLQKLAELVPSGRYMTQAPLVIAVVIEDSRFAVSDGSRAIQSMLLTAWNEGVGSNWVGFTGMDSGVKELLGIPFEMDVLALLPMGYPVNKVGKGKKSRKSIGEVAHREKFGQGWE